MDIPCAGKVTHVQVKEPYGNLEMVTCRLSSCRPEYITANNAREGVMQYIYIDR